MPGSKNGGHKNRHVMSQAQWRQPMDVRHA